MKALSLTALTAVFFGTHCQAIDGCPVGATRCNDNIAEICDFANRYQEFANCDLMSKQSGTPFVCAYVEEKTPYGHISGHTCVPESKAANGDAR